MSNDYDKSVFIQAYDGCFVVNWITFDIVDQILALIKIIFDKVIVCTIIKLCIS